MADIKKSCQGGASLRGLEVLGTKRVTAEEVGRYKTQVSLPLRRARITPIILAMTVFQN